MEDKKLTVIFPGVRGTEIPLLYYTSKHYEDQGFEKKFITYPQEFSLDDYPRIYQFYKDQIEKLHLEDYEEVIFIAKSIGTVAACELKEKLRLDNVKLILLTPLEATLPYISEDNQIILVAAGNKDSLLDSKKLEDVCSKAKVNYIIEDGVGHRMEAGSDLVRNLEIIKDVVSKL